MKIAKQEVIANNIEVVGDTDYSLVGNNTHGYYVFANATAIKKVTVVGVELLLTYQNGHGYLYGSYDCPDNGFRLYDEGVLDKIYRDEGQFYNEEDLDEVLAGLEKEWGLKELSEEDVFSLYQLICDNTPTLEEMEIKHELEDFYYFVKDSEGDIEKMEYEEVNLNAHYVAYLKPKED